MLPLLAVVLVWLGSQTAFVASLDRSFLDRYSAGLSYTTGEPVLLIAIDEKSLAALGRWPWSRQQHAKLIQTLHQGGATAIGLDVVFSESNQADPDGDAALAQAIAEHGVVLLPIPTQGAFDDPETIAHMASLWPAAKFVHSEINADPDGVVRIIHRWMDGGGRALPALPLALLNPELALDASALRDFADGSQRRVPENPMLVSNIALPDGLPVYSYVDVLDGTVDADMYRGYRVLVGYTAMDLGMRFMTPRSAARKQTLSGAQLSAVVANELSGGFGIRPAEDNVRLGWNIALAVLIAVFMVWLPRWWSLLPLLLGLIAALLVPALLLRSSMLWLGMASALTTVALCGLILLVQRLMRERSRTRQILADAQAMASGLVDAVIALGPEDELVFASAGRSDLLPELAASKAERQRGLDPLIRTLPPISALLDAPHHLTHAHQVELVGPTGILHPVTIHVAPSNVYARGGRMLTLSRSNSQLPNAIEQDPLTGLTTRGLLWAGLQRLEGQADSDGKALSLAIIDLDSFKRINEALGMGEGDRALVAIAHALTDAVPDAVQLARWGGDQFAMLVHKPADEQAFADDLLGVINHVKHASDDIQISASIGMASQDQSNTTTALVQRAERALRQAKRGGGGQAIVEHGGNVGWSAENLQLERDLRHALAHGEFVMHYQPVMHTGTGQFASMEALVRWQHPERGLLGPDVFMDTIEAVGLDIALGELVLELVQQDMQVLAAQGIVLPVAVNVSTRHFERPDFPDHIAAMQLVQDCAPGSLRIEVTESMALTEPERAGRQVLALNEHGVSVALDDFGCGHSSLALLRSLSIRQIKIDRSFVAGADHDAGSQALIRGILGMARGLQLQVVAEGVETPAQSLWLQRLGCNLHQGYLFARPTALHALPALLQNPPAVPQSDAEPAMTGSPSSKL